MTREEAERALLLHCVHTIDDFLKRHDVKAAKAYPNIEPGNGWISKPDLWPAFVEFQVERIALK